MNFLAVECWHFMVVHPVLVTFADNKEDKFRLYASLHTPENWHVAKNHPSEKENFIFQTFQTSNFGFHDNISGCIGTG